VARGRNLFHGAGDARIASDGRACASCHPDGRDDGLVWSTPNGPRQTPMLAGRTVGTSPYSWIGDATNVADHLAHTIKRLQGKGLTGDDREALARYVAVMSVPPAAERPEPESAAVVARGERLFESPETECASCHGRAGIEPDGMAHDVKSRATGDKQRSFDTPSLRFVGGSAPYFHDGRYADLRSLLLATSGKMGKTSHLAPDELEALEAYVRTL
jgi:mono/diheme cytochrome c family protein